MSVKSDAATPKELSSPLAGTWKLIDGEYIDEKGDLMQYRDVKMTALKVMDDGKFWASGAGTYKIDKNRY
ncbi:hypothetical protein [Thalassotalea mangrovi]|uniref:Lipocalin-like domain-containing protein n=1 Tax=Thalassotalea mangrovi TaxID=2572245 RepID=A0A4U1B4I9_9GAMM|nr:hypothetical protein [Thalassotalea mangrovi]TKB44336.1 hypothetical protein E8M12_11840 [Thalassotalea mangrovi]